MSELDVIGYPSPSTRFLEKFKIPAGSKMQPQFLCLAGQCGGRFGGLKRSDEEELWKKMEEEAGVRHKLRNATKTEIVTDQVSSGPRPAPHFLIECFYDVRPLCFDIDFHVFKEIPLEKFSGEILQVLLEDVIRKLFSISSWRRRAVVCTAPPKKKRKEVAVLAEDGSGSVAEHSFFYFIKQGFHVIFPELLLNKHHGGFVRHALIKALTVRYGEQEQYGRLVVDAESAELLEPPPSSSGNSGAVIRIKSLKPYVGRTILVEKWAEIVDECVFTNNGLRMIGAHKVAKCPKTENHKGRKLAGDRCACCEGRRNLDEGRPYSVAAVYGGNGELPDHDAPPDAEGKPAVEKRLAVLKDCMDMSLAATLEQLTLHKDATTVGGLEKSPGVLLTDDGQSYLPDYSAAKFEFSQEDRVSVAGTGLPAGKRASLARGEPVAQKKLYMQPFNAEVPGTVEEDKRLWITLTGGALGDQGCYAIFLSWLQSLFERQASYRLIRDGVKDDGPNLWTVLGADIKTLSIHVPGMFDKKTGRRVPVDPATTFPSFRVFPKENFCVNVGRAHSSNRMFLEGFYSKKGELYIVRPGCFSSNQPADASRCKCSRAKSFFQLYEVSGKNHMGNTRGIDAVTREIKDVNYLLLRIAEAPLLKAGGAGEETNGEIMKAGGGWKHVAEFTGAANAGSQEQAVGVPKVVVPKMFVDEQARGMAAFSEAASAGVARVFPIVLGVNKKRVRAEPVGDEQIAYEVNNLGGKCHTCRSYVVFPRCRVPGSSQCMCEVPQRVPPQFTCALCSTKCDFRAGLAECACEDAVPTYMWKKPKNK